MHRRGTDDGMSDVDEGDHDGAEEDEDMPILSSKDAQMDDEDDDDLEKEQMENKLAVITEMTTWNSALLFHLLNIFRSNQLSDEDENLGEEIKEHNELRGRARGNK